MSTTAPFVLLIEDDPINQALATKILTIHGIPYTAATNGEEGLSLARKHRPDVILMDLSLPGINGWDLTAHIRRDPALAGVRILALSAHAMDDDRRRALASGCDDYLSKPYRPADLVKMIRRLHEARPVAASASEQTDETSKAP